MFTSQLLLVWVAIAEYCGLGGLNNRNVFLSVLEAKESEIKVAADLVSGEDLLPVSETVVSIVMVLTW